jgi:preprotein translocase subunit SecE
MSWDVIEENLKQGNMVYKEIKKNCEYPKRSDAFETFLVVVLYILFLSVAAVTVYAFSRIVGLVFS